MHAAMLQNPNVLSASGSVDHLGKPVSTVVMRKASCEQYEVQRFSVDANYFETMGLSLRDGRGFKTHSDNDKRVLVVNELFAKSIGLDHAIGQSFEIDSVTYDIVGILKDFHTKDFFSKAQPAIFTLAAEEDFRYLSLRVKNGSEAATNHALQAAWARLYPEIPFQGGQQEDVWSNYFVSVDRSETFNKVIASIAVLLASLGLYGLVTLNVSGRIKEFSIRKTLGAGAKNIASVIIRQYVLLTLAALLVGAPVSYIFTKAYLDMLFAYPMPMDYSGTAIALIILVLVLLAVIFTQIRKVLKFSPVNGLKAD
jgi:ABC-type antimicrobial peptide transport system permease subunit